MVRNNELKFHSGGKVIK